MIMFNIFASTTTTTFKQYSRNTDCPLTIGSNNSKLSRMTSSVLLTVMYILCMVMPKYHSIIHAQDIQEVNFQMNEEEEIGTLVGDIVDPSGLLAKYGQSVVTNQMQYSILVDSNNENIATYFRIDENLGLLYVDRVIDRETVCSYLDSCVLTLSVAAKMLQPPKNFESITVKIQIDDINDNEPQFIAPVENLVIAEDKAVDSKIPLPEAIDLDIGVNSELSYTLGTETSKFSISTSTNSNGVNKAELVITEALDREVKDNYKLTLYASDAGSNPLSSSVLLNITIVDVNDNVAKFEQELYESDVMEDLPVGSIVATVKANDYDLGQAGKVVYSFTTRTNALFGNVFTIDAESGEILLSRALDFETRQEYVLTVTAKDDTPVAEMDETTVKIYVHDVNDFTPQITVSTLTSNGQAQVAENSVVDSFVAHVKVIDQDSRLNGEVKCTLDNERFTLQKLQDTQYTLVTAHVLDRENKSFSDITITCYDQGTPSLNSSINVQISITDQNDNSPIFDEASSPSDGPVTIIVEENNPENFYITTVKATDADFGINARVSYKFDSENPYFSIDSNSGIIKAIQSLDYEEQHEIDLNVIAFDGGSPSLSASTSVLVQILDLNDNAPKFTQPNGHYIFTVLENQPIDTNIGQIQARDRDSPNYDVIEYSILDLSMKYYFKIDPQTGMLRSNVKFDRESKSLYEFTVSAFNPDAIYLSSESLVSVYIEDENDWNPVFLFPSSENHTLQIKPNTPAGEMVTQVKAYDPDDGNNAWLNYYIMSGNRDAFFVIGESSGFLTASKDLSESKQTVFNLTIEISDNGSPPKANREYLVIALNATDASAGGLPANMAILAALVSITGLIMILLVVAICWLLYKSRFKMRAGDDKYMDSVVISPSGDGIAYPNTMSNAAHLQKKPNHVDFTSDSGSDLGKKQVPNILDGLDMSHIKVDLNSSICKEGAEDYNNVPRTSNFDEVQMSPQSKLVSFHPATGPQKPQFLHFNNVPGSTSDKQDSDSNSAHSEDGSNTDSGCVLSETGPEEGSRHQHHPSSFITRPQTLVTSPHQQQPHSGYMVMKDVKSPPVIVYPANRQYTNSPSPCMELDNKIIYNSKLNNNSQHSPKSKLFQNPQQQYVSPPQRRSSLKNSALNTGKDSCNVLPIPPKRPQKRVNFSNSNPVNSYNVNGKPPPNPKSTPNWPDVCRTQTPTLPQQSNSNNNNILLINDADDNDNRRNVNSFNGNTNRNNNNTPPQQFTEPVLNYPYFKDSDSLMFYKGGGVEDDLDSKRSGLGGGCFSEATDNTSESATSGSYIVDGNDELVECNT